MWILVRYLLVTISIGEIFQFLRGMPGNSEYTVYLYTVYFFVSMG